MKVEVSFKAILILQSFPLEKRKTILFTSDSSPNLSETFKYIYNEITTPKFRYSYDIKLYLKRILRIDVAWIDKFRLPYLLGKADYIFVDDFHPLIYTVRFRPSQEVIQVWHAVGAFKTVGFSRTGKRADHLSIR